MAKYADYDPPASPETIKNLIRIGNKPEHVAFLAKRRKKLPREPVTRTVVQLEDELEAAKRRITGLEIANATLLSEIDFLYDMIEENE